MLLSWKFWIAVLLLLGLGWLVEDAYGWAAVLSSWQAVPPTSLALALALMLASYLLRAIRFHDFFHQYTRGQFGRLTRITVLHNFFNNMLPMRSGEAAFPILMKQHFGLPIRHSAPALIWLRLLDLYALLSLAMVSLGSQLGLQSSLFYSLAATLMLFPLLVLPLQRLIEHQLLRLTHPLAPKLLELMTALPRSPLAFARALLWTFTNWILKIAVFSWLLQQFIPMPLSAAWTGATTGELSSVLPIHGIAGAGTYEAGVVAGLLPWGIESASALAAAVNLHLFVLGTTLVLTGAIALATWRWRKADDTSHIVAQ